MKRNGVMKIFGIWAQIVRVRAQIVWVCLSYEDIWNSSINCMSMFELPNRPNTREQDNDPVFLRVTQLSPVTDFKD